MIVTLLTRHRLVLSDRELDDDLVLPLGLDLVPDVSEEVTLFGVCVLDLLDAPAHRRHAQDGVLLDLHGLAELVALDLVVAVVEDLFDVWSLAHDEAKHHPAVVRRQVDLHVLEEAGVPERVDVARQVRDGEEVPRFLSEVGEDVFAGDASVAHYLEHRDGQPLGLFGGCGRKAHLGFGRGRCGDTRGSGIAGGRGGPPRDGRSGGAVGRDACILPVRARHPREQRDEHRGQDGEQA